jgi:hypothetical protein
LFSSMTCNFQLNVASINHGTTLRGDTLAFEKPKKPETIFPRKESRIPRNAKPDIFAPKFDDAEDIDEDDDGEDGIDDNKVLKKKHRHEFRYFLRQKLYFGSLLFNSRVRKTAH